jgi:Urease beta subunit
LQGRQCAPPPAVTTIRAKLPEATLLSNKFRSAAFTGEIPRDETGVPAPPTPQSASRLVTSRTMVSLTSKPPLWPPSTVTTQADDVWFVEFGTVKAAARFMSALSSPRVSESLRCLCTPSTVANFALQSTRCCVAAVASSGHLLWIPVDSVTSTATDIMSYLQLRTGCKGGDLTRRVHWAGTFPIAASTPVYQYCTRCPEHFRHMRDGAVDDKVKSACTYHPGLFCWQFRIRQILEAPNKAARVPQPTFVDIPPPPLPALATHTLETFLLPRPLPMLSCLSLREVPGPNLEDDLVPVAVRAVYGRKSHFKPTLPSPALMVSQTRPLGGFRAPLSKPVDMFREILRPAVAAPLWSWFIDSTPTLEPPLLLMPIHADVRRCVLPVTPSARRFYAKAKYDITIPPHHNNRVGLVWQSPVCASPLPRAKPPPSGPAPDPARFIVCDHQCVRRVFPTITVPVKNTGKREIVVTINEHFAEVDVALDFDRTLAYGYDSVSPYRIFLL